MVQRSGRYIVFALALGISSVKPTRIIALALAGSLLLVGLGAHTAGATTTPTVIRPGWGLGYCSEGCWVPYDGSSHNGRWVVGPGTPPLGVGSAELKASTGDALESDYSTDTAPDLATFVAGYSGFSNTSSWDAALEILTNADLGPGAYQVLAWIPPIHHGWKTFHPMTQGGWEWDCNGDGSSDGGGAYSDFFTDCTNAGTKADAVALVATSGTSYVDNVEIGPAGATLVFDMEPPTITTNDVSQPEGDSGTHPMYFEVRLSGPDDVPIDLRYRTVDGTAIAGKDYLERHTTVTFAPGTVYPHFTVPMIGDTKVEPDETFRAHILSTTNSTFTDHSVTATILNDD